MLQTRDHQWVVKGFIDVRRNIYPIGNDTKVVSKLFEIVLLPMLQRFAQCTSLELKLPSKQNYYPDFTFVDGEGHLYAVDLKSSYYEGERINGITLGSYWGYFRDRKSTRNTDYPYSKYKLHLVLGVLYRQADNIGDLGSAYSLSELDRIASSLSDIKVFLQPKWRVASDAPGSGNTRNIGSVDNVESLVNGKGVFAQLGEAVFDDYWMGYLNRTDAREAGLVKPPYTDLESYSRYIQRRSGNLNRGKR